MNLRSLFHQCVSSKQIRVFNGEIIVLAGKSFTMRLLAGNIVYNFTVTHDETLDSTTGENEFQITVHYRNFNGGGGGGSSSPETEHQRSIQFPRSGDRSSSPAPLMSEVLQEFEVPEQVQGDMVDHFKFYLERISRRNLRREGIIRVHVTVDARVMSSDRAAEVQSRMTMRRENRQSQAVRAVPEMTTTMTSSPAKKSAVEALVRERVRSGGEEEERECSICLEGFGLGVEVIRMPCLHVYHKDCILRWLERTHFCPFCRFKLPC